VLSNGHFGEQLQALKCPADAQPDPPMDREPVEHLTIEHDSAPVGTVQPEEAIEERGLARPVWTDQPDDLAGVGAQTHIRQGSDAPEVLGDSLGFQ
jgi:hypothetical protein